MAAAMLVAVINAFAITRLRVNSIVATLGTLAAFRGLAKLEGSGRNIRVDDFNLLGRARIDVMGLQVPLAVFILLAVLALFWFLMSQTRYGRHMYGMGANPKAALLAGINLQRNVVIGFLLTGLAVGLAALIAVSQVGAVAPTTGQGLELLAITGIILGGASLAGGRGTIPGTIIAILILAVLDNGLTLSRITSFWQEVVRGSLLVAAGDQRPRPVRRRSRDRAGRQVGRHLERLELERISQAGVRYRRCSGRRRAGHKAVNGNSCGDHEGPFGRRFPESRRFEVLQGNRGQGAHAHVPRSVPRQ